MTRVWRRASKYIVSTSLAYKGGGGSSQKGKVEEEQNRCVAMMGLTFIITPRNTLFIVNFFANHRINLFRAFCGPLERKDTMRASVVC